MKRDERKIALRCAVYTCVSTDSGLEHSRQESQQKTDAAPDDGGGVEGTPARSVGRCAVR